MDLLGILNVTRDSFSDGGRFLEPSAAVTHARSLVASGATYVDLGAESTHPDAEDVPAHNELDRLLPILTTLVADGIRVSIDTHKPEVMATAIEHGATMINDVSGLRDPAAIAALRNVECPIILMHSTSAAPRAERRDIAPESIVPSIVEFFRRRIDALAAAGIAPERLILDPGMGFFLSQCPAVSLAVLANLSRLRELGRPLCVSTSRKSFIGAVLGGDETPRAVAERGIGTAVSELWAALEDVEYIRTHDPQAVCDAVTMWRAIADRRRTD